MANSLSQNSPLRTSRPSFVSRLRSALALRRQRRALRQLDETRLNDIGISRTKALEEARRPLWDAPCSWRR
ncbi:DUF1127 domain-containing protein [Phaeobacter sp. HF9A]|uniref:DUF1127 domain-containing protein n=1 Tax=Phaeobacter sp. HF9A TaxID=2721561 RepID=UPI00142FE36D|nr:DUF1127 domain-containing protein [Phaeobacter sp. HF9A]NIZ15268.1 DUF1127 domain-containing protein [Phaeobacter sp. HF9A]